MTRRYVIGIIVVGLLGSGGWALAQQERTSEQAPTPEGGQFAVSPAGDTAVLLETTSGRTWELTRSAEGLSVWLPAKRIDSEEQAHEWRNNESELKRILADRERQRKDEERQRKLAEEKKEQAARQDPGQQGRNPNHPSEIARRNREDKYDKMEKKQLQEELKRLQKEFLVAETTARHADEQRDPAAEAYQTAADDRKPYLVLGMIEAEARCRKPMETYKRVRADLEAAKRAYAKLLLAE